MDRPGAGSSFTAQHRARHGFQRQPTHSEHSCSTSLSPNRPVIRWQLANCYGVTFQIAGELLKSWQRKQKKAAPKSACARSAVGRDDTRAEANRRLAGSRARYRKAEKWGSFGVPHSTDPRGSGIDKKLSSLFNEPITFSAVEAGRYRWT